MVKNSDWMKGKCGVILGAGNSSAIAWGIAKACFERVAEIVLTDMSLSKD